MWCDLQPLTLQQFKLTIILLMSNQTKDKQVLLAILNVKKYAKNLKKKASNLQDSNDDLNFIQAVSSPSFFDQRGQQIYELNSPLITKSSYNQSFQSLTRQKKCIYCRNREHSMTNIPGSRKNQREGRKNSDVLAQPVSPSKTFTHTIARVNLSQSYKIGVVGQNSSNAIFKKQRKDSCQTQLKLQTKKQSQNQRKSRQKNNSQLQTQQMNSTICIPIIRTKQSTKQSIVSPLPKRIQDPKLVEQLLDQIVKLKSQICDYRKALIVIKSKYLQLEHKCREKAQVQHLLEVFKQKIVVNQNQKQVLYQTIKKQNQKIVNFQNQIIEISKKFNNHYISQLNRLVKLQVENQIYKQLLLTKTPKIGQTKQSNKSKGKQQKVEQKLDKKLGKKWESQCLSSESQSEGDAYVKPMKINQGHICKNQSDIQTKYRAFKIQGK